MRSDIILTIPSDAAAEQLAVTTTLGVPLFLRSIFVLADAGHRHVVLVATERSHRSIQRLWQKYALGRGLQLRLLTPEQVGTAEFAAATTARCVVLPATTVLTLHWIKEVLTPALDGTAELDRAGIVCLNTDVQALHAALAHVAVQPHTAIRRRYCHVATADDLPRLEHFLCEEIRFSTNGVVARYINKRISLPLSRMLARTRIHPHAITVLNMMVGLASGIGTAGVLYISLLNGALLFQLASILDGCDGEVAKLTHRTSYFGQLIDTISDNSATFSFFIGLMIHEYRVGGHVSAFFWGAALLGGLVSLIVMILRFQLRYTNSLSFVTFDREYLQPMIRNNPALVPTIIRTALPLFKKEWYSILFMTLGIVGILPVALYGTTIFLWGGIGLISWMGQHAGVRQPVTATARTHGTSTAPLA